MEKYIQLGTVLVVSSDPEFERAAINAFHALTAGQTQRASFSVRVARTEKAALETIREIAPPPETEMLSVFLHDNPPALDAIGIIERALDELTGIESLFWVLFLPQFTPEAARQRMHRRVDWQLPADLPAIKKSTAFVVHGHQPVWLYGPGDRKFDDCRYEVWWGDDLVGVTNLEEGTKKASFADRVTRSGLLYPAASYAKIHPIVRRITTVETTLVLLPLAEMDKPYRALSARRFLLRDRQNGGTLIPMVDLRLIGRDTVPWEVDVVVTPPMNGCSDVEADNAENPVIPADGDIPSAGT